MFTPSGPPQGGRSLSTPRGIWVSGAGRCLGAFPGSPCSIGWQLASCNPAISRQRRLGGGGGGVG